jgi:hypothetical protein
MGLRSLRPAQPHTSPPHPPALGAEVGQGVIQFSHIRSSVGGTGAPLGIVGGQEGQEVITVQRSEDDTTPEAFLNEVGKLRPRDEGGKGLGRLGMGGGQGGKGDGVHHPGSSGCCSHHAGTGQEEPQSAFLPVHDGTDGVANPGVGLPPGPRVIALAGGDGHVARAIPAPLAAATVRSIRSRMARARFLRSFRGSQAM